MLFLTPLLIYGPYDSEEAALGVFASQVHYRELLRGTWLFWLNDLGFGTPLPIGHRFDLHPIVALGAVAPLRIVLSLVWLAHIALMTVYFLRLAALSALRRPLRIVLLACYLFSAVTVCHFYMNDWVTAVIAWSLYPVLVYYLRRAVLHDAVSSFWRTAAALALVFGFWVLNTHPGYVAPLAVMLGVYTVALAPLRVRVYGCLVAAFLLCAAMSSERLYYAVSEMQAFPAWLPRTVQPGYTPAAYVSAALVPITPGDPAARGPFIGLVLGIAALASVLRFKTVADAHLRACTIAFAVASVISVAPLALGSSAIWLFRDAMIFFGLFAGGYVLQTALDSPTRWRRRFTWTLIAVQLGQQAAAVRPALQAYGRYAGRLQFYRHQGEVAGLGRTLVQQGRSFGPRVYMSKEVQGLVRGALSPYGIHAGTDLVFLGLNPVNGWFKMISMDRLHPSADLMHGYIVGERDVIENDALLDVLGIDLVWTTAAEGAVPSGLHAVDRTAVTTFLGEHDLVLLGNGDAWPDAVLMKPEARELKLRRRPACSHAAALCREYGPLVEKRLPEHVEWQASNGHYRALVPPADRDRLLFVSALYRPEWEATSPRGPLQVDAVADAFLGVTVPAGVQEIEIVFAPRVRMALAWLSGLTIVAVVLFVAAGRWRGRRARFGAAHEVATAR